MLKIENIRVNKIFISGVIYKEVWFVFPSRRKVFIYLTPLQALPASLIPLRGAGLTC